MTMVTDKEAADVIDRLHESRSRVAAMCKEHRGPRMSIPADRQRDDDLFICDTVEDAASEIAALRRRVEQMEAVVKVARDVAGAYDAACFEGLSEVIAETTDERLKDLVMRRITWHHAELNDALVALSTPTGSDNAAPLKTEG